MKLSEHFTLEELTKSSTARRLGIDNTPSDNQIGKLKMLAESILEPIREEFGHPIVVSSGYRSPKLNKAVGGVSTSQHQMAEAADIHTLSDTLEDNKVLYSLVLKMVKEGKIKVGQLIWEYGSDKGPDWVHASLPTEKHRNQILRIK